MFDICPFPRTDFHISILTGQTEAAAALCSMLNKEWFWEKTQPGDDNIYIVGKMGAHGVVTTQTTFASGDLEDWNNTMIDMKRSFTNIRLFFFVGWASGVPDFEAYPVKDIRLGDVVAGIPRADGEPALSIYPSGSGDMRTLGFPGVETSVPSVVLDGMSRFLEQTRKHGSREITALINDMFARHPELPKDPEQEGPIKRQIGFSEANTTM
ncbi:hypothetical protein BDW69DRAFT_184949 [Aspergillus filifer]